MDAEAMRLAQALKASGIESDDRYIELLDRMMDIIISGGDVPNASGNTI